MRHFIRKTKAENHSLLILSVFCLLFWTCGASRPLSHSSNYPGTANLPAGNSDPSFNETRDSFSSSSPASPTFPSSKNQLAQSSNYSHSLGIPASAQSAARKADSENSSAAPAVRKDSSSTSIVPAQTPEGSSWSAMDLILGPKSVIARPGSEVILIAGVRDRSGYLRTNQKINWSISPESVGHFSKIQSRELSNFLVLDFVKPQILSDTQAVTTTSRSEIILDRGTPNPNDDVAVRRGESWISVTSPREGVTQVSAQAPNIENAGNCVQTARIIWVDAAVKLPESKVLDFGSAYALTTALRRVSNEQPLERWRVRYEICGNSSAVFADGNKMLEIYSNSKGEARIEMRQPVARQEETVVSIQIIRPEDSEFPEPIVVQDSKLHFRWQPNTVNIVKSIPREAFIGSVVPAVITVANLTDQPLRNLRVVDLQQPGLVLKGAVPEGKAEIDGHQWLIETLEPFATYSIHLNYRVEQPGNYVSFAQLQMQNLGNDLKIECSAQLSAGNDVSPYAPKIPKASTEQSGAGTVKISPANDANQPSASDPFGSETKPLPPPEIDGNSVYAPLDETASQKTKSELKTNSETEKSDSSDSPKTTPAPNLNPELAVKDSEFAPVFPPADPDAQIGLEIKAPKNIKIGTEFNVKFVLSNRTHLDLHNVGIQVSNSRGISNKDKQDPCFVERNIRKFGSKDRITIGSSFHALLPGEQSIAVKLILPNGKEYRQEARLNISDTGKAGAPLSQPQDSTNLGTDWTPDSQTTESNAANRSDGANENGDSNSPKPISPTETNATSDDPLALDASPLPDGQTPSGPLNPTAPADGAVPSTVPINAPDSATPTNPANPAAQTGRSTPAAPANSAAQTTPINPANSANPTNAGDVAPSTSAVKRSDRATSEDSQVTVGNVIDSGDPQIDPSFTIAIQESPTAPLVGESFVYSLELINTTNIPVKHLEILLAISPENAEIQKESVTGPTNPKVDLKTGFVKYPPIPEIAPGQSVVCRVGVKALQAGVCQTHVKLLENGSPKTQKIHETTIRSKKTKP